MNIHPRLIEFPRPKQRGNVNEINSSQGKWNQPTLSRPPKLLIRNYFVEIVSIPEAKEGRIFILR
jgi:hypothetical protein